MLQMFVEGANYIAAECQVMMRGQGILKIEAAECWGHTDHIPWDQEWRSWQPQVIACHMRGNTGIILAFRLLSVQTAEAFMSEMVRARNCLWELNWCKTGRARGLRVSSFIRLCLSVFCGIILPISQVFLSCQLVGIENFSSQSKPTTE